MRVDPDDAIAANNLAWLLSARGDQAQALELARRARRRLPDRAEINHTLGWIQHRRSRPAEALPYLRMAVEQQPDNALYHLHLGLAYAAADEAALACESVATARRLDRDVDAGIEAHAELARLDCPPPPRVAAASEAR